MDEDELLAAYGTRPPTDALPRIRELLDALAREGAAADTLSMKLLCVHLFNTASVDDVLRIWRAKESSWDAHAAIDVRLLCGAGLDVTKSHLAQDGSDEARAALDHITACEAAGDFEEFDPESETADDSVGARFPGFDHASSASSTSALSHSGVLEGRSTSARSPSW